MTGRASSSSSFSYQWTYDVFLNFRGEDTRNGFTGNLFNALRRKGIHTFMDDGELRKGDEITPSLLKAIEESRMAITVFSKNYASSTFCLDELVKILRCIKGNSRLVWPIFYDVEPSEVRHQKGNYEEALAMHQKYFKANEEKVQNWKLALREAANLSGSHFNPGHEYEYQFIEKIVNEISSKIKRSPLHIAKYPIGLESRVIKINSLLEVESHDEVIMVGICGIGGMGKSTITRAVYNSIADQFEGLCFLHDIKENSSKLGLESMQERMLSKTLGINIKVEDVNEGIPIIKRRLNQKKILLILDNVDKQEQLENLAGNCDWFGSGSRIIITTRDKHLLARHGVERLYEVKELNNEESLELLSRNAFKKNQADSSYMKVLHCVVKYAKGLPLALEVIGSHLFGKSIEEWKSSIDIYRRIPNEEVHKILKVSYDGLGEVEQEIFLDIASFFKGKDIKYVKDMVQHARGFDPSYGIGVLMDKCLINYYYNYVEMHDLIRDMGREIVRQESPNEPGKRSRLWNHEDIVHVLENNTGTNKISVIIQEYLSEIIKVDWDGKAFKKMVNLKILILHGCFSSYLKHLPKSLRVIQCRESSCLQSLEPIKRLENLSVLDLSWNDFITQVLDVSSIPNLRKLKLDCCKNLIEIHESVGYLPKLELLSVQWCKSLRTFPHGIKLPSLKDLKLWGCPSLEKFPKILEKMEYMRELDLTLTNLELPLPCSITMLLELEVSTMLCSNVKKIITRDCSLSDEFLPFLLTWFANVKYLDLSGSNFTILPPQIKECHFLEILLLHGCKHLREIKGISPNIKFLNASKCTSLSSESRNILLSQELHEAGDKQFVLPGAKIPEWSWNYYSEGALISFSFRNKFPTVVICFVIPQAVDYCSWEGLYVNVNINKKVIFNDVWVWHEHVRYSMLEDHIFLLGDGLRWIFERNGVDKVFLESGWNDVKIGLHLKDTKKRVKKPMTEIGIKVLKQENRMEDINFPNPYGGVLSPSDSKEKDTNKSEWFEYYTRWIAPEYASDTGSSSQGYNINGDEWHSWDRLWDWEAALALDDHNVNRATFSMLFGSTSDQVLSPSDSKEKDTNKSEWFEYYTPWEAPEYASGTVSSSQGYNINSDEWYPLDRLWDWEGPLALDDHNVNRAPFSMLFGSTSDQEDNSAGDCLSLQAPLDDLDWASHLYSPGSNSDPSNSQGLQQKHLTSINLQQIRKVSESENVRKVKGNDIIVYRRKRRRIR